MRVIMSNNEGKMFDVSSIIKMPFNLKSSESNYLNVLELDLFLDSISKLKSYLEFSNKIFIYDNKNNIQFSGFLFEKQIQDNYFVKCKFYNEGYYINKNEDTFQFEKKEMKECIDEIFEKFEIKHEETECPSLQVDEIFFNRALGSIITDFSSKIEKETGKIYLLTINNDGSFKFGKSNKQKYLDGEIEPKIYLSTKEKDIFNPLNYLLGINYTESISNMVTKVKIYKKEGNDGVLGLGEQTNEENKEKYGIIQKTFSLEEGEKKDPEEILKNELKKLSKVEKILELQVISDLELKAMDIIKIKLKDYFIDGVFYVLEVQNNINSDSEYIADIKLELLEKEEI